MKISSKIGLSTALVLGLTLVSWLFTFMTSQAYNKLSAESSKLDQMVLATTNFRAASRQMTVEAYQSLFLTNGKDRLAFTETSLMAQERLEKLSLLGFATGPEVEALNSNLQELKNQFTQILDLQSAGDMEKARLSMKTTIEEHFKKINLQRITELLEATQKKARATQEKADNAAHTLGLMAPIIMVLVFVITAVFFIPIAILFRHKMDAILATMDAVDFTNNSFPTLAIEGSNELDLMSKNLNELIGRLKDSKIQLESQHNQAIELSEQLRKGDQLLATVLQTLPIAVFGKDIKKNYQWCIWNKHAENLFGVPAQDCLGKYDSDFFPKEMADSFRVKDIEANQTFVDIDIPEETVNTLHGWVTLHTRMVVIRDQNGEPSVLLGMSEDITSKKLTEQTIHNQQLKLVQSSKLASLGEMAAGIAHEINNPLAIIYGSISQLSKFANEPEKFARKIDAMKKSSERIAKIVKGLKKFSRSSEAPSYSSHSLAAIVRETLGLVEGKSKQHNTPIIFDLQTESVIQCDEVEIEQILINLIGNAIDAVQTLAEKWVKVEVYDDFQSVVLRVTDSGSGIPEGVKEKLFNPFFTTKNPGEGTGLGLSITKGILDEHKATIEVVPNLPNTCFEIRFFKMAVPHVA